MSQAVISALWSKDLLVSTARFWVEVMDWGRLPELIQSAACD